MVPDGWGIFSDGRWFVILLFGIFFISFKDMIIIDRYIILYTMVSFFSISPYLRKNNSI